MPEKSWLWYLLGSDLERIQNFIRPNRSEKANPHKQSTAQKADRTAASPCDQNSNRAKREADPPNWVEKWTLIILIFAFMAAVAAAIEAHRLVTATNIAIQDSDDAAKKQREIAVDTEQRQLRAYVFLDRSAIQDFGARQAPIFLGELKNFGSTPAYRLRRQFQLVDGDYPLKDPLPPLPALGKYQSDLGPTDTVFVGPLVSKSVLTEDEAAAILAGRRALYAYGVATYFDAFEKLRCVRFRLLYRGLSPVSPAIAMEHAEEGNDSDKDCETIP